MSVHLFSQYEGGIGRGDASASSYVSPVPENAVFSGGTGRGDVCMPSYLAPLPPLAVYSGGYGRGDVSNLISESPLPVILSSFTALSEKNSVKLRWSTSAEINNSGFELERKTASEKISWQKITFVRGSGTTSENRSYSYDDLKLPKGKYDYRLKQIDYNGSFEYFALSEPVIIGKPGKYDIAQSYPNPSNPKCKIDFQIPADCKVTLKLFDIIGREVYTLIDSYLAADYHTIEFDGSALSSGVYFYRLTAGSYTRTMKLILVK